MKQRADAIKEKNKNLEQYLEDWTAQHDETEIKLNTLEDELEREKYSVQIYKEKYEYYHTKSESLSEVK